MSNQRRQSQQRLARFEQFEKRLMMTADPVVNLLPPLDLSLPREPMVAEVASEFVAPIAPSEFPSVELTVADLDPGPSVQDQETTYGPTVETISQLAQQANNPVADAANIGEQFGFDGSGQTIAVIDSGIAWDHAALGNGFGKGNKVVGGWDFAENDADPYDDGPSGFHGTHVAGIIGSEDSQYQGVSSGADLVALRVFDDQGGGDLQWVEQALQWVHEHRNDFANPITTVNLSLGTTWNSSNTPDWATLEDEFAQLKADGLFVSVAAGNSFQDYNTSGLSYPASSPHVVPVASHGADGSLSDFSQRNDRVLAAPGESILSTVPSFLFGGTRNDPFLGASGTSMAAPYVAGASALLREAYQSIGIDGVNQEMLYQQFRDTADQIFDSVTSRNYSQLNLEAAIQAVLALKDKAEPPTESPTPGPTVPNPAPPAPERPTGFSDWNLQNGTLTINGTSGDDAISLDTSDSRYTTVTVNGSSQQFELDQIDQIRVRGGGGRDSLSVQLGQQDDSVIIAENSVYVSNDQYRIAAKGVSTIDVYDSDGSGKLSFIDSSGNDHVSVNAQQRTASITSVGFKGTGHGFSQVYTSSTAGNDRLSFVGSKGADTFVSNDARNMLRNDSFRAVADNFSQIEFNGNGGADRAQLYGTSGNDSFVLSPREAIVQTDNSTLNVSDIERINVFSHDGQDRLTMYDSAGDDVYRSHGDVRTMTGDGYLNFVWNVADAQVFASNGYDVAQISDTAGNDRLMSDGGNITFVTDTGTTKANDFDRVNVVARNGGYDTASIVGTDGRDSVYATQDSVNVKFSTGQVNRAVGFDGVEFDGGEGADHAMLAGGDQNDRLVVGQDKISFESTMQMLQLVNTEETRFEGNGGIDEVVFGEFESLDLLSSIGDRATAYLQDRKITASDFDVLEAETVDDAIAQYDMEAVDYLYLLRGQWKKR